MDSSIIINIKQLVGIGNPRAPLRGEELSKLGSLEDAYVIIEGEEIAGYGTMAELTSKKIKRPSNQIDAHDRMVLPAWCDSHTHLVYAGSREGEFVDKIRGLSYAEIAERGGGILNSAHRLAATSDAELFNDAQQRLNEAILTGTANIEIKSGYGLTLDQELRMLRIIRRLKNENRVTIRSTFLGAHAFPAEYKDNREAYVQLVIEKMLPAVAAEQLADYIDVFCEKNFFSLEQTDRICRAGIKYGLKPKLHANQLSASGAVELGVKLKAISVDHLETMDVDAIHALKESRTIGTLLPTAAFFLRAPFQPARELISSGCAVALASDCNPGSSPGYNMNFVVALACIALRMMPEEAVNAATINGAFAIELDKQTGTVAAGKKADLIITKKIPSLAYLPYSFSTNLIDKTIVKGEIYQA